MSETSVGIWSVGTYLFIIHLKQAFLHQVTGTINDPRNDEEQQIFFFELPALLGNQPVQHNCLSIPYNLSRHDGPLWEYYLALVH
jgi:hypothetical protein